MWIFDILEITGISEGFLKIDTVQLGLILLQIQVICDRDALVRF